MTIYTISYGLLQANCYLLVDDDSKAAIVIDPAAPPSLVLSQINQTIQVKYICVTHAHFDHLEFCSEWREVTQGNIVISINERELLKNPNLNLSQSFYNKPIIYPPADLYVKDDSTIFFGNNLSVKVIETPGHTKGSVCFLCNNALFSGDTLFANGSRGRTDFPTGDEIQIKQSNSFLAQ